MKKFGTILALCAALSGVARTAHAGDVPFGRPVVACSKRPTTNRPGDFAMRAAQAAMGRAIDRVQCGSSREAGLALASIILTTVQSTDLEERRLYETYIRERFRQYIDATIREGIIERK